MSERDGWNHLYLFDAATGQVKNQITQRRVGRARRRPRGRARSGRSGSAPAASVPGRTRTTSTSPRELRRHRSHDAHRGRRHARSRRSRPTGAFFVDTWSRVDLPPVTELRRAADGKLVCELETRRRQRSARRPAGDRPERFVAKGRDGKTDIYGIIFRPTNFDPAKKYPVIEDIYAGPHDHFVPQGVRPRAAASSALAELGFIVVQIDGMGTNWRSQGVPRRVLEEPRRRRLPRPHRVDARPPPRSTRRWTSRASASTAAAPAGRTRSRRCSRHGDFYKVGRRRLRLPRQPHGQDLVERSVDGLAGRPALRGAVERHARARSSTGQAAADRRRTRPQRRSRLARCRS